MKPRPSCDEVQLLAPEVALGIASGDERALVLAHARSCGECRRVIEDLSETADALLLLGPLREPAPGFESTVFAQMQRPEPRARIRIKLIAAGLAAMLVTGAVAFWLTSDERRIASHYRDALAVADGEYFGVVPLRTSSGDRAGHMFAYEGHPTWVFVVFATPLEQGRYEAELETRGGDIHRLGSLDITAGKVTWGRDLPVGLRSVRAVRISEVDGSAVVQATFPSG